MASLADIPFLSGYTQQNALNREQEAHGLRQQIGLMQFQTQTADQLEKTRLREQEQQFRAGFRPGMSQEELTAHAARFAGPKELLTSQTASLDRKAKIQADAENRLLQLQNAKQQADMFHEVRMGRLTTDQDKAAETVRHNRVVEQMTAANQRINNDLRSMGLQIQQQGLDIKQQGLQGQLGERSQRQVAALGTALERANLPEADAVLRAVDDAVAKTPVLPEYISGPKSFLPDITPGLPEGVREGRQAFQKLFNITLKNRSGAAVTTPEFERLKKEFATGIWKKPEQLIAGVNQARNIIAKHYRSVAAGYGPDALKAYNQNLRETGGTPILEPGNDTGWKDL